MRVVEAFAGPGGWSEALKALGIDAVGYEWDEHACATAEAAGHTRVQADVANVDLVKLRRRGKIHGVILSPPCPTFSAAGNGAGKHDAPFIRAHAKHVREASRWIDCEYRGWRDERSALTLEPLRWILTLKPDWFALEQVPAVLPLWDLYCDILAEHGYWTECGNLQAEQYGVPQTRKRAVAVGSRSDVSLPTPTRRKYRKGVPQHEGDETLLPWISMANALGSASTLRSNYGTGGDPKARGERTGDEPAPTVTSKIDRNLWMNASFNTGSNGYDQSPPRGVETPSATINSKFRSATWVRLGNQEHSAVREVNEPAATVRYGERMNACDWQPSAVRVSVADYPWQGSRTQQYQQVGNAVPPLLAHAILSAIPEVGSRA